MENKNAGTTPFNFQQSKILWKDRKRILGLPLSFTIYTVDENRLYVQQGLFSTSVSELLLYRVLDIKSHRSFGQKLLGVGDVTLYNNDASDSQIVLKNIRNPEAVRRFLSQIIETRRTEKGVTGREMYGASAREPMGHGPAPRPGFEDIDGDGIPDIIQ